jgi:hypothetical protein
MKSLPDILLKVKSINYTLPANWSKHQEVPFKLIGIIDDMYSIAHIAETTVKEYPTAENVLVYNEIIEQMRIMFVDKLKMTAIGLSIMDRAVLVNKTVIKILKEKQYPYSPDQKSVSHY